MHGTPRRRVSGALSSVAALLLAACGSDSNDAPPTFIEGDWTSCTTEATPQGTFDVRAGLSFAGDRYQFELLGYGTSTDGTCAGSGFLLDSGWGSFTVGGDVQAALGAGTVTARAIDLMEYQGQGQSAPRYTIAYLDATPEPDVLYVNLTGIASTPQARPTTLEESRPFRRGR